MRWSAAFIPTLRDDPAEAEAVSHRLLVRAGFVRQLSSGHYSMLPLGQRTRRKISEIIREEMDLIGGQQLHLPALHPAEIWKRSGRWEAVGEEMFRLKDRKGADNCLGMTHEEVFALLASELPSYRNLPQIWYQIQTKFRDEPRPKSGLLRVREFTMKDSYSLDLDRAGLDAAFESHRQAYLRIFARCGLSVTMVEASSGIMGGSESVEFIVRSDAGEDWIVTCSSCGYAANLERAITRLPPVADPAPDGSDPAMFPTPGVRTIAALAAFDLMATPERQIKTLVYIIDGQPTLVLLRGDHELLEQKLIDTAGTANLRPAQPDEVRASLGASPGSLGAVGVKLPVLADLALQERRGMVTGANVDDHHLRGVDMDRHIKVGTWADLRTVRAGEACSRCGHPVEIWKGIEVGHIFKLGTRFSEAMGAFFQDQQGGSHPVVMGSYGLGVERAMATVVEAHHDEKGIVWPVAVAPYEVVVTVLRADDPTTLEAGEELWRELLASGVDALLDDRIERPGVKFADAELVGIPYRITVGPKSLAQGAVEVSTRGQGETDLVPIKEVVGRVALRVAAAR